MGRRQASWLPRVALVASAWALFMALAPAEVSGQAASGKKATVTPESKQASMVELVAWSKQPGLVAMDDRNYPFFALEKPRPYSLIVLFTASGAKYKCTKCKEVEAEFALLAKSHHVERKGDYKDSGLFFVRVDFDDAPKVFSGYDIKGVPIILHIPPSYASSGGSDSKAYAVDPKDRMAMHSLVDAESLGNFVHARTGHRIEIYHSPYVIIMIMLVLLGLLAIGARFAIDMLPRLMRLAQSKSLWMLASALCYTCSISGLVFDIIRNPPPFYADPRSGTVMFFHPQSGQQFVVEGFIIGAYNVLAAVAAIGLIDSATSTRIKSERSRSYWVGGCGVAFLFFFYQVFSCYRWKNRWYLNA